MTLADKITFSRVLLAPVFFVLYFIPIWFGLGTVPLTIAVWILFALIELSDFLDGQAARGLNQVSPFGKLFDPFADVIARLTYFVCFTFSGVMPLWAFLIIFYREFGMSFLRLLTLQRGVTMGARPGGKLKAVFYMLAGIASFLMVSIQRTGVFASSAAAVAEAAFLLYILSVLLSVGSFLDYVVQFRKIK